MKDQNLFSDFQSIFYVGYLYLIILGLFNEAIFYAFNDIDILRFSSLSDIITSPIAVMSESLLRMIVFGLVLILVLILPKRLANNKDKKWFGKLFPGFKKQGIEITIDSTRNMLLFTFALGLMGFYIGTGIGGGYKVNKQIQNNTLNFNDEIKLTKGKTKTVSIIGKNSSFLFYIDKGDSIIQTIPIHGGVLQSFHDSKKKKEN